ncbi:MAG: hypothetical protein ACHQF3_08135 [Alphaproteobacteria bacterium]
MTVHRYPPQALRGDYLRAGVGLVLTLALAALAEGQPIATAALGGGALLFLAFGIRTALRQRTAIAVLDEGISTSGGPCVNLAWRELSAIKLRYYATKRDRTGGWMQLTLAAGRRRLAIESSLDGFVELTGRAALAARAKGLALDTATENNLLALGIRPAAERA